MKKKIRKSLLIVAGCLLLVLAAVGIVLPILPTTPLLLLASYCFLRSSERLYHWLFNHPVLGRYIRNYLLYKAVDKRSKIFALIILWSGLLLSIILIKKSFVSVVLALIGLGVTRHIISLRTMTKEQEAALCQTDAASQQQLSKTA